MYSFVNYLALLVDEESSEGLNLRHYICAPSWLPKSQGGSVASTVETFF